MSQKLAHQPFPIGNVLATQVNHMMPMGMDQAFYPPQFQYPVTEHGHHSMPGYGPPMTVSSMANPLVSMPTPLKPHKADNRYELWPEASPRQGKRNTTDTTMLDYSAGGGENMHISGESLEDDDRNYSCANYAFNSHASVSANANTTMTAPNLPAHQQAPPRLPVPHLAMPTSGIKSRKENLVQRRVGSRSSSSTATPVGTRNSTRRMSQPPRLVIPTSASAPDTSANATSPCADTLFSASVSRNNSAGEFGTNISNMRTASSGSAFTNGSTGSKRMRTFTPASAKVIDDEDEPRKGMFREPDEVIE